jgi:hypothetical protein
MMWMRTKERSAAPALRAGRRGCGFVLDSDAQPDSDVEPVVADEATLEVDERRDPGANGHEDEDENEDDATETESESESIEAHSGHSQPAGQYYRRCSTMGGAAAGGQWAVRLSAGRASCGFGFFALPAEGGEGVARKWKARRRTANVIYMNQKRSQTRWI